VSKKKTKNWTIRDPISCPNCKTPVKAVRESFGWQIYNDADGDFGPHKCEATKNPRQFLRDSGWMGCRGCGGTVKWVDSGLKRIPIGANGERHRCRETKLPEDLRHWSKDLSYPWEYQMSIEEWERVQKLQEDPKEIAANAWLNAEAEAILKAMSKK